MSGVITDDAAGSSPPPSESPSPTSSSRESHRLTYPRFLWRALSLSTNGSWRFYAWMTLLTAVALVGAHAWAIQVRDGMAVTNMSDHVSWGLYIANFTFLVGMAAGAVMMVIPAYLYHDRQMHDVVIIGELLAVASIAMCMMFVTVDLGRPDRFWHLIPGIGRFHWPVSMLTWDVIVLTGYLLINLHICGYMLYMRFLGRTPNKNWYVPFVFISIIWAVSIHTVTAFLYCGLGGRPFWNTALLAPRFLASAFVSGPAFIVIVLQIIDRMAGMQIPDGPIRTLVRIMRVAICINMIMLLSEVFTEFYTDSLHVAAAEYLWFGLHGKSGLVPWIWTSLILNVIALCMILSRKATRNFTWLNIGCVAAFVGIWIEKGMGLIVPGFIPSTMGEIVEYAPSLAEWQITAGVWAGGLMMLTISVKIMVGVLTHDAELGD